MLETTKVQRKWNLYIAERKVILYLEKLPFKTGVKMKIFVGEDKREFISSPLQGMLEKSLHSGGTDNNFSPDTKNKDHWKWQM